MGLIEKMKFWKKKPEKIFTPTTLDELINVAAGTGKGGAPERKRSRGSWAPKKRERTPARQKRKRLRQMAKRARRVARITAKS